MTGVRRVILNALGFAWLIFAVWMSWVAHVDGLLLRIAIPAYVVTNPVLFGVTGWVRGRHQSLLTTVWPALVVVAWFLTPPVSLAIRYSGDQHMGYYWETPLTFGDLFWNTLLHRQDWFTFAYLAFCAGVYLACATLSRRMFRGKAGDGLTGNQGHNAI